VNGHLPKCIYCLSQDNPFDREHVIPQAFGNFEPTSFILYDAVCKPCNSYFGKTLDFALSRDSTEALLRFRYGVKAPSEANQLPYHRIELKVGESGPWLGATVVLDTDCAGTGIEPVPVPQVAFRWKDASDWVFLLERDIDDPGKVAAYVEAPPGSVEMRLMGPTLDDQDRLVAKLSNLSIRFVQQGTFEAPIATDGKVQVKIAAKVDATIFRAIAKIAFNYAAHQHGIDFVLRSDFDDVRNYIRMGTVPPWEVVVQPTYEPILFDDSRNLRQTFGHLITFDWNLGNTGLLAQVSLFNSMTYRVAICPVYSGIWHNGIRRGHHFDIGDKKITPLAASSSKPSPTGC
jgi:hypothetical protein